MPTIESPLAGGSGTVEAAVGIALVVISAALIFGIIRVVGNNAGIR